MFFLREAAYLYVDTTKLFEMLTLTLVALIKRTAVTLPYTTRTATIAQRPHPLMIKLHSTAV